MPTSTFDGAASASVLPAAFPLTDTSTTGYHNVLVLGNAQSLTWEAANVTGIRNGTTAQTFAVYNTYTAGTPDYERLELFWTGNTATIKVAAAGTGSNRTLSIQTGGIQQLILGTTATDGVLFQNIGATAVVNGRFRGPVITLTSTSGTELGFNNAPSYSPSASSTMTCVAHQIAPTVNYASAGAGRVQCLRIAPTATALPTGNNAAITLSSGANSLGGIKWFNVADETTNYEYAQLGFASNIFSISSVKGGSGTLRGIQIGITGNAVGFFGTTPATQPAGIANADGTLADITTKFNTLLNNVIETLGLAAVA